MMNDALRPLRSAKTIRRLLCPHRVWFWFKARTGVNRISAPGSSFPIWATLWFHIALVDKEGRLLSLEVFSSSYRTIFPYLSHAKTVALQISFVWSLLVSEPLVGNWRSLGLHMHTPTPWVFTFMSFITPPPAPEFKMKRLKCDQGCVLTSAWIICVPCFLKWFLPFSLPPEKTD